jgi:hypothetical protein
MGIIIKGTITGDMVIIMAPGTHSRRVILDIKEAGIVGVPMVMSEQGQFVEALRNHKRRAQQYKRAGIVQQGLHEIVPVVSQQTVNLPGADII